MDTAHAQPITPEQVIRVARLARLHLEPAEIDDTARRLGAVLEHMTCLAALPLGGVEPMTRAIDEPAVLRPDEPGPTLPIEALRAMAPAGMEAPIETPGAPDDAPSAPAFFFAVPKVIGD